MIPPLIQDIETADMSASWGDAADSALQLLSSLESNQIFWLAVLVVLALAQYKGNFLGVIFENMHIGGNNIAKWLMSLAPFRETNINDDVLKEVIALKELVDTFPHTMEESVRVGIEKAIAPYQLETINETLKVQSSYLHEMENDITTRLDDHDKELQLVVQSIFTAEQAFMVLAEDNPRAMRIIEQKKLPERKNLAAFGKALNEVAKANDTDN